MKNLNCFKACKHPRAKLFCVKLCCVNGRTQVSNLLHFSAREKWNAIEIFSFKNLDLQVSPQEKQKWKEKILKKLIALKRTTFKLQSTLKIWDSQKFQRNSKATFKNLILMQIRVWRVLPTNVLEFQQNLILISLTSNIENLKLQTRHSPLHSATFHNDRFSVTFKKMYESFFLCCIWVIKHKISPNVHNHLY